MNKRLSRRSKREQQFGRPAPAPPRPKELPQPNVFFVAAVVMAGALGLLSFAWLGLTLHHIWQVSDRQALVRTLPDVRQAAPGETAILEGRIAASEPARYKEFVAYIRERQRGGVGRSISWTEVVGQEKPPFSVEAGSRVYRIANRTYAFDRLLHHWMDAKRVDEGPTTFRSAITIQGLATQSPVMAVGRLVAASGDALAFHADSVVGLSRADYLDRLAGRRTSSWTFAAMLALLAPLLSYLGLRGVYRVMGWRWGRRGRSDAR